MIFFLFLHKKCMLWYSFKAPDWGETSLSEHRTRYAVVIRIKGASNEYPLFLLFFFFKFFIIFFVYFYDKVAIPGLMQCLTYWPCVLKMMQQPAFFLIKLTEAVLQKYDWWQSCSTDSSVSAIVYFFYFFFCCFFFFFHSLSLPIAVSLIPFHCFTTENFSLPEGRV